MTVTGSQLSHLQRRTVASAPFEARSLPSAEKVTACTLSTWPSKVCKSLPLATSHNSIEFPSPALANMVPVGLNATLLSLLDFMLWINFPLTIFHSFSSSEHASVSPRGLNATPKTISVCFSVLSNFPLAASHNFTVLSPLADASISPDGSNATQNISCWCLLRVRSSVPLAASHSLTELSELTLVSIQPEGSKVTYLTLD